MSAAARILDGSAIAAEIRSDVTRQANAHGPMCLAAVLMGGDDGARLYAQSQAKTCAKVGIEYKLVEVANDAPQAQLLQAIDELNRDATIAGIILQLPLPRHIDVTTAQYRIDPYKDVEGVTPANAGMLFFGAPLAAPCTALAAMELVRRSGVAIRGARAVVLGRSRIVGKPVAMMLLEEHATVTICHSATRDLAEQTRAADILIAAVGKPRFITGDMLKPGALVIDVGINRIPERDAAGKEISKTVGDVDFDSAARVAGAITPVPGGVGPVTIAMLLRNTVAAAQSAGAKIAMTGDAPPPTAAREPSTPAELPPQMICPRCGYDLHGIPEDTCPECGFGYQYRAVENLALIAATRVESSYHAATWWAGAAAILAHPASIALCLLLGLVAFTLPKLRAAAGPLLFFALLGVPIGVITMRMARYGVGQPMMLGAMICFCLAIFRSAPHFSDLPYLDASLTLAIRNSLRIRRFVTWGVLAIALLAIVLRLTLSW